VGQNAAAVTPWRAVQRAAGHALRRAKRRALNKEMYWLSSPIEPFEQLIKNRIGTSQIEHLFG
jgi:hypothetical protein